MDRAAILGLVVGAVLGGLYAWGQWRSLRQAQQSTAAGLAGQLPAALARLGLLVVILAVLVTVPAEVLNKWWLTGALLVCYSVPFFWRLKQFNRRNK